MSALLLAVLWAAGGWPALSQTNLTYAWTNFVGQPGATSMGASDGTGSAAQFWSPYGVAVYTDGNVFVADTGNCTIRMATAAGVVTTLAGRAENHGTNDGTGSAARFNGPTGVAVDSGGNVFVADEENHTIRKVTSAGVVTTLAGLAGQILPLGADGTGSAARFFDPYGVAVDSAGNVFVADAGNNTIRKVTSAGVVTTLAGSAGMASQGTNDGTGSAARFFWPCGVAVDSAGNVFVADTGNNTIRMVTSAGVVTTLAGSAGNPGTADGTGSAARFNGPSGVTLDSAGNVIVADQRNNTIRKVTSAGVVTTLAGSAGASGTNDGPDTAARFYYPSGVAADSSGNLFVADALNNRVSKGTLMYVPGVTVQPQSQTNSAGATVTFLVIATGLDPMGYEWQKNGTNLTNGGNISGSSTSTLTLLAVTLNDAGDYTVVITNSYGSVTSYATTLTVLAAPSITVPPESQTVFAGSNFSFNVTVEAFPPVSYQWSLNGTNIPGGTAASLVLTNVQLENAGDYLVAVTNSLGYAVSAPATLTVLAPPQILSQPASQIGYWGEGLSFRVWAKGSLPLSYQWYIEGFPIPWATNAVLSFSDLELSDAGDYWVEVTNLYGNAISAPATLIVNPAGVSLGLYPGLSITGAVGKSFGIQYVTNVGATNGWMAVGNITLTQRVQLWMDTSVNVSGGSQPRRFYRVVAIP